MGVLLKLLTLAIGVALIFKLGLAQMVEAQLRDVLVAVVELYQRPEHQDAGMAHSIDQYQGILRRAALQLVPGSK